MFKLIIFLKKIYWKIAKKIGFAILIRDERQSIHSPVLKKYITSTGTYYLPKYAYQDVIRREIIKNRIFDKDVFDLSKKYITPNSIVIDAGANYGQLSILFSKLYHNTIIYSFEASKYIFDILDINIKLNSNNIKAINCVLSDKTDKQYLKIPNLKKYGTYGSLNLEFSSNKKNTYENRTLIRKIDDFSYEKKISFMKIDVQGFDLNVLKGSIKTIKRHRMPIIFEYENTLEDKMNFKFDDFIIFFNKINYRFVTAVNNNFLVLPNKND